MKKIKQFAVSVVVILCVVPEISHSGGEPSPIMQELQSVKTKLSSDIDNLEERFNEHVLGLHNPADQREDRTSKDVVNSVGNELLTDALTVQNWKNLQAQVDSIVKSVGLLNQGLIGAIAGFLGGIGIGILARVPKMYSFVRDKWKARRPRNKSSQTPTQLSGRVTPNVSTNFSKSRTDDEKKEAVYETRVVTHTLKEKSTRKILELHNPDESDDWSPRTRQEAAEDIRLRGIPYVSRGETNNQVEIVARETRSGTWYVQTKPDKHGKNNLSELPDPPVM